MKKNIKKKKSPEEKNIEEKVNKNNELRQKLFNIIVKIEEYIFEDDDEKEKEKSNINNKEKDNQQNDESTFNTILDDLPIEQQISLYKDSISELKLNISTLVEERYNIEFLENSISSKKEILYNLNKQKQNLDKITNNHQRAFEDIQKDEQTILIKKIANDIKISKDEYRDLRNKYKETNELIKEQNNALYILEDNCNFIKENIEFKKGNLELNTERKTINQLKKEENEIKTLLNNQKQIYLKQINDQHNIIQRIESECNYLIQISEDIVKEQRRKEIQEKLKNYEIAQKKWNTVQNLKILNQSKKISKKKIEKEKQTVPIINKESNTIENFYGEQEKND